MFSATARGALYGLGGSGIWRKVMAVSCSLRFRFLVGTTLCSSVANAASDRDSASRAALKRVLAERPKEGAGGKRTQTFLGSHHC